MNSADAADQIVNQTVNMSFKGIEVLAKISGLGAKNLATFLYAALNDTKKTKGKTRMQNMLRSGKEIKVFAVRNEDLKQFCVEAKRYGILYSALRDKKSIDGMCDIMVRTEDSVRINRIVERFKLATVDTAVIKSDIQKDKGEKVAQSEKANQKIDDLVNDLLGDSPKDLNAIQSDERNPSMAKIKKSHLSEPISKKAPNKAQGTIDLHTRKSVREELFEIKVNQSKEKPVKSIPSKSKVKVSNKKLKMKAR